MTIHQPIPGGTFGGNDLFRHLERVCQALEPTEAQREQARTRYEGVGLWLWLWLAEAKALLLESASIYVQGSIALGTAVRPSGRNEFDVDLMCYLPHGGSHQDPAYIKKVIGDRLRENGHYAPLLKEMPRCWRLDYANEFHLDITPSVVNPSCSRGGELVPDKKLECWKASNPKGYRNLFERRAALEPVVKSVAFGAQDAARADVAPFPQHRPHKGVLRRAVQLAKRHRDVYFENRDASLAPISVIITTLASQSYERCVTSREYDNGYDLIRDVLMRMPEFIDIRHSGSDVRYHVWNESTQGENFAEKWNADPRRAAAFFEWHRRAVADLVGLSSLRGLDQVTKSLGAAFGSRPATDAARMFTDELSAARGSRALSVAPKVGLVGLGVAAASTPVRANNFFGR